MSTTRINTGIGVGQGTAIYVAAILGAGILALPSLAAKVAGPASILSWVGLVLLSIPMAATFAALGARYPDGGGVATFVTKAFRRRASRSGLTWVVRSPTCSLTMVPPGPPCECERFLRTSSVCGHPGRRRGIRQCGE
jgi:amino acid transporter